MGKKRKASRALKPSGPRDLDPADARLGPITSYKDVADPEDEFVMNREYIAFDDHTDDDDYDDDSGGPRPKRRRQLDKARAPLELSDEEVLAPDDDDDDDDSDEELQDAEEEEEEDKTRLGKKKTKKARAGGRPDKDEDDDDEEGDEGDDQGWWGASKADYYNADALETEADALGEEKEARRLQKKKLDAMADEDFVFDEADWRAGAADAADAVKATDAGTEQETASAPVVVTEVLRDVSVPADMPPDERYMLLQTRYPEFDHLAQELADLRPRLVQLRLDAEATAQPGAKTSFAAVRYWVAGCYVAALASYFAILTSPARDGDTEDKARGRDGDQLVATATALCPADLREHEVMETLVRCREAWVKFRDLKGEPLAGITTQEETATLAKATKATIAATTATTPITTTTSKPKKRQQRTDPLISADKASKKAKAKVVKSRAIEAAVADLYDLGLTPPSSSAAPVSLPAAAGDNNSDFGEEETLDATLAAEKAARKRSLRFYTSQIVQKANKRAGASREAGGDADIPYRERLRDRQTRLNAAAERRGSRDSKHGAALDHLSTTTGGEDGDNNNDDGNYDQTLPPTRGADADDVYYDTVAGATASRKAAKEARKEALAGAGALDRVVEAEEVGPDGKRRVTYAIEKNKGLTPRRKKEVRNPRVKQRERMRKRVKKLNSMRGTVKREGPGPYMGESTGITRAIKSVAL